MKLFVWDFHGVLEKGNELAVLEITNAVLKQFGYRKRLSQKQCLTFYGLKWYQYFQNLLPEKPLDHHLELQAACINYQINHPETIARNIRPNDHAPEVIEKISHHHDQIVISNTQPGALRMFLQVINLANYFLPDKALAANAHNKDAIVKKHHLLTNYITGKNFDGFIYIGDSPEDIELVSVTGGKTYLYSHPGKPHKKAQSDYKITDLREVLKEV